MYRQKPAPTVVMFRMQTVMGPLVAPHQKKQGIIIFPHTQMNDYQGITNVFCIEIVVLYSAKL